MIYCLGTWCFLGKQLQWERENNDIAALDSFEDYIIFCSHSAPNL